MTTTKLWNCKDKAKQQTWSPFSPLGPAGPELPYQQKKKNHPAARLNIISYKCMFLYGFLTSRPVSPGSPVSPFSPGRPGCPDSPCVKSKIKFNFKIELKDSFDKFRLKTYPQTSFSCFPWKTRLPLLKINLKQALTAACRAQARS